MAAILGAVAIETIQGPPDLDEVLKKLQQSLGGLFGKSGGSGGGSDSGDGSGFNFSGKQ